MRNAPLFLNPAVRSQEKSRRATEQLCTTLHPGLGGLWEDNPERADVRSYICRNEPAREEVNCLSSTTATKTGRRCATSTINEIITESNDDQHTLADLFNELKKFKSAHDGKLGAEVKLLKSDRGLKKHKLLIFSEYMATAHYLRNQLEAGGTLKSC